MSIKFIHNILSKMFTRSKEIPITSSQDDSTLHVEIANTSGQSNSQNGVCRTAGRISYGSSRVSLDGTLSRRDRIARRRVQLSV
mmetsp:Transcript_50843/g.58318  ORF Transcript_50843/g.58318 Transcript_50843/m.58318 type:complete len:84 (+) Transcript_50843:343-594(+)